jgi:3-oxoacyl-[acyl-carrier-protein] synthase III
VARAAVLAGLGTHVPPDVLTNDMLAEVLDTSDEWIRTRTGIRQRHVAGERTTTGDLAVAAGERALASAGLTRADVVVVATTTPDRQCPATAPTVASRLGMSGTPAFDVQAACTGFVYGLATVSSMINAGLFETALFIGADTFTETLDPADRSGRALIGDGAGAVVLRAGESDEDGALLAFDLGSDGEHVGLLEVPAVTRAERAAGATRGYFHMEGRPVFSRAVAAMTDSVHKVLGQVGWSTADVDRLVPHQANARILASVADQLDLPEDRVVSNIADVGNTVAASIPLALGYGMRHQGLRSGHNVVLTGFGAGLTWGSVAVRWPKINDIGS